MTMGNNADELNKLKRKKTALNEEIKELNKKIITLELELQNSLQEFGLTKFSTKHVAITMTESEVPDVEDWDSFYNYIVENNAPYLLQRRPMQGAMSEIWNSGQKIDGVNKIKKVTIRTKTI